MVSFTLIVNFFDYKTSLHKLIVDIVYETLQCCNGNQSRAARLLKISRNTLRKYMKEIEKSEE